MLKTMDNETFGKVQPGKRALIIYATLTGNSEKIAMAFGRVLEHYGFDTVDALKKLKNGYIGQVHIKTKGGLLDKETEMPKNMEQIWDGLLDSDYSGWLVLEFQAKPKNMSRVELLKYNADALRRTKLFS